MSSYVERTETERKEQITRIIKQLNDYDFSPQKFEQLKNVYKQFSQFVKTGERIEINERFPELTPPRRLKGILTNNSKEKCYIKFSVMAV